MIRIYASVLGVLVLGAMFASGVEAQTAGSGTANVSSSLQGALAVLDSTLDLTGQKDAQGAIPNEEAVDAQLDAIGSTLQQISETLSATSSGGFIIPSGLPDTGHHP